MDKVGIYGFLRYCLPLFPNASRTLAPLVLVLAIAGIVYAALLAVGQSDMKRLSGACLFVDLEHGHQAKPRPTGCRKLRYRSHSATVDDHA